MSPLLCAPQCFPQGEELSSFSTTGGESGDETTIRGTIMILRLTPSNQSRQLRFRQIEETLMAQPHAYSSGDPLLYSKKANLFLFLSWHFY